MYFSIHVVIFEITFVDIPIGISPSCTTMNRDGVSVYDSSCGECSVGYTGLTGHINKHCFPIPVDSYERSTTTDGGSGSRSSGSVVVGSGSGVSSTRTVVPYLTNFDVIDNKQTCPGKCSVV